MNNENNFVLTVCGHDKTVDSIKLNLFESSDASQEYCNTINDLESKNDFWFTAREISENTQYSLNAFLPFKLEMLLSLDDLSVQKLVKEVDSYELCKALKGASDAVKGKIFKNVSMRAVKMLKEEMDWMGEIPANIAKRNQEKILSIYFYN